MPTYSTLLLDPPWEERGAGKIVRGAQRHYNLLKTKEIAPVVRDSGFWKPDSNAHVYMWVTNNKVPDGLEVFKDLNVRFITQIPWVKYKDDKPQLGIGRYFGGVGETLYFGVIGRGFAVRTPPNNIKGILESPDGDLTIMSPRRKHSEKPVEQYLLIESRSKGPFVEFFARSKREGWDSWGNEV